MKKNKYWIETTEEYANSEANWALPPNDYAKTEQWKDLRGKVKKEYKKREYDNLDPKIQAVLDKFGGKLI